MASKEYSPNKKLLVLAGVFLAVFLTPFTHPRIAGAIQEAFLMLADYAHEHVLLCVVPAMFIAGAIVVFLNQQAVMKYLGPKANKLVAYSVASVSGAILAVCSCTVLPLGSCGQYLGDRAFLQGVRVETRDDPHGGIGRVRLHYRSDHADSVS